MGGASNPSTDPPEMIATQVFALNEHEFMEQMNAAKLDVGYRDFCAHLLIPLNECRRSTFYMPWCCENERHAYEKCQYLEYKRRIAKMDASEH